MRTKPHRCWSCCRQPTITPRPAPPPLSSPQQRARGHIYATRLTPYRPLRRHGSTWPGDDQATFRGMCSSPLFPDFLHICFLLDLLQLLLHPLLPSPCAHGHAVRLKPPLVLRTARVPTIIPPSRGFSCYCTSQLPQGCNPPCVQLRPHYRRVSTMVVQQPSLQHQRWVAINPHRAPIVPRARG